MDSVCTGQTRCFFTSRLKTHYLDAGPKVRVNRSSKPWNSRPCSPWQRKQKRWLIERILQENKTEFLARWHREADEEGDPKAQYRLGVRYASGMGVSRDENEAVKWFRKSADQGDAEAQYHLALMYPEGRSMPKNEKTAADLFLKAAENGVAEAQYRLAFEYAEGKSIPNDDEAAVLWLRKAAEQEHAEAHFKLGACYEMGKGLYRTTSEPMPGTALLLSQ